MDIYKLLNEIKETLLVYRGQLTIMLIYANQADSNTVANRLTKVNQLLNDIDSALSKIK